MSTKPSNCPKWMREIISIPSFWPCPFGDNWRQPNFRYSHFFFLLSSNHFWSSSTSLELWLFLFRLLFWWFSISLLRLPFAHRYEYLTAHVWHVASTYVSLRSILNWFSTSFSIFFCCRQFGVLHIDDNRPRKSLNMLTCAYYIIDIVDVAVW